jgi:hypothetical protein
MDAIDGVFKQQDAFRVLWVLCFMFPDTAVSSTGVRPQNLMELVVEVLLSRH